MQQSARMDANMRRDRVLPAFAGAVFAACLVSVMGLAGCGSSSNASGDTERAPVDAGAAELAFNPGVARGEDLLERGEMEAALAEFERVIETNPEVTLAYLRAGDIYRERGEYDVAERRYADAARLEPGNFDAQYYHGLTLQLLSRLDDAVRAYLRALSIQPDDFHANLNLGTTFLQLGEPEQGLPYAVRATELRPNDGAARVNLGATYAALDRHAEAVREYGVASELMTLGPELLINLAESQGQLGRFSEMEGTLRQVVRMDPSAEVWERLGSAQFRSRRYQDALESFTTAVQKDQSHYPAHNGIAVCLLNRYLWSGRTDTAALDGAMDALRTSLSIRRDQPRILELLTRYGR